MIYRGVDCILKETFQLQEGKQIFLFLLNGCSAMSNLHFNIIYANSTIATNALVKDKGSARSEKRYVPFHAGKVAVTISTVSPRGLQATASLLFALSETWAAVTS